MGDWVNIRPLPNIRQLYRCNNPPVLLHQPWHLRHLNLLLTPLTSTTTSIHFDRRSAHGDTAGINFHETTASLEGDFGTGFNNGLLPSLNMELGTGVAEPGGAGFQVQGAGYVEAVVFAGLFAFFAVGGLVFGAFYVAETVILNGQMAVVVDDFGAVVFGEQVQVFLGVDVDLFLVRFILKAQFIAAFTLMGLGFQSGAGFVFRQRVRRCVGSVVGSILAPQVKSARLLSPLAVLASILRASSLASVNGWPLASALYSTASSLGASPWWSAALHPAGALPHSLCSHHACISVRCTCCPLSRDLP